MEREQTTLRLPAKLLNELRQEAQVSGLSFNSYILMCIEHRKPITPIAPIQQEGNRSPFRIE